MYIPNNISIKRNPLFFCLKVIFIIVKFLCLNDVRFSLVNNIIKIRKDFVFCLFFCSRERETMAFNQQPSAKKPPNMGNNLESLQNLMSIIENDTAQPMGLFSAMTGYNDEGYSTTVSSSEDQPIISKSEKDVQELSLVVNEYNRSLNNKTFLVKTITARDNVIHQNLSKREKTTLKQFIIDEIDKCTKAYDPKDEKLNEYYDNTPVIMTEKKSNESSKYKPITNLCRIKEV